eukprot:14036224-Alexandrium_andersonii.AAC.1
MAGAAGQPVRPATLGEVLGSARVLSSMPSTMIGRAHASILPTRLWSSSVMPCPTSVVWLRRSRHVLKLPDCGRWM